MLFPKFVPVLQHFPRRGMADAPSAVIQELSSQQIGAQLPGGAKVAIGVGSRGISQLPALVRATVSYFRGQGLSPWIFPAMGSHGGATPEGQRDVLAHYGVTEASVGSPVISSLDVLSLGATPDGIETCVDAKAWASDAIFLINRVKWHTSFEAPVESGLLKMTAIGLGKAQGARVYHTHAARIGMGTVVESVGRHVLASGKVLGGLAIIEDAHHEVGKLAVLPAAEIEGKERELLQLARSWMPRIPFDEIDALVIDEIGKDISGTGMDSKVVNRHPYGNLNPWPWAPKIRRIYVRDLDASSLGNAIGIGMADIISDRLYNKIDWAVTKMNGLTASNLSVIRTPIRSRDDAEGFQLLSQSVGRTRPEAVTFVRVRNTLELGRMLVSESLLRERPLGDNLSLVGPPAEPRVGPDGYLEDFPSPREFSQQGVVAADK